MALDKDCTDRSYLFGRLLAIADAIENSTYTDGDRRETNAMHIQKIFSLRPMDTWLMLWDKIHPYRRLEQYKPKPHLVPAQLSCRAALLGQRPPLRPRQTEGLQTVPHLPGGLSIHCGAFGGAGAGNFGWSLRILVVYMILRTGADFLPTTKNAIVRPLQGGQWHLCAIFYPEIRSSSSQIGAETFAISR